LAQLLLLAGGISALICDYGLDQFITLLDRQRDLQTAGFDKLTDSSHTRPQAMTT
jgi:hypothetical protein